MDSTTSRMAGRRRIWPRLLLLLTSCALPAPWPAAAWAAMAAAPPAMRQIQQTLLTAVARLPANHPRRQRYRLAIPFDAALFPPDDALGEPAGQPQDPALAGWLALPRGQRLYDVLILPDEDYYWRDGGADYTAQFIVHPAPAANAAGATLTVLQVHARRRYGKAFHLLGRTGPGFYWDIRPAAPSPAAAAALLDDAARWLAQPGGR